MSAASSSPAGRRPRLGELRLNRRAAAPTHPEAISGDFHHRRESVIGSLADQANVFWNRGDVSHAGSVKVDAHLVADSVRSGNCSIAILASTSLPLLTQRLISKHCDK